MKPYILEMNDLNALEVFKRVQHLPYSLLLDSADEAHPDARHSFVACMPVEMIEAKNGIIVVTNAKEQKTIEDTDPFSFVQKRLQHYRLSVLQNPELPPFHGGAAGFFGYDLGRSIENLPEHSKDNPEMPDMTIGIYDQVFAWDHQTRTGMLITHSDSEQKAEVKQQHFLNLLEQKAPSFDFEGLDIEWNSNFTQERYEEQVQKIIDYIHAGDIFQANMSQRFDADLPQDFDAFAHYTSLREISPAPFAGFFNLGNIKISSSSPERFLTVRGEQVETKPIKGTRPHVEDEVLDTVYRNSLENSEKDRAENIMIVDLLRNDLSKVCRGDSVKVPKLCELESFKTVHHLVSTITAKLRQGYNALDLLRACFPGGSITGAPKIRAMEIIEELEPTRRSPYCGSLGYIGFDGNMDTNILIRTLIFQDNKVSFQVGGGIVADSNPQEEYEETLTKATGIFASFKPKTIQKQKVA
ncbi:MAG: aminodeoxychorismate synthase component I [Alphaproteobacteria bacterium]